MYGKLAGAWEQRCPDMHIHVIHVYIASCIYIKAIIAYSTHTVQNVLITYWLGILIFQTFQCWIAYIHVLCNSHDI